MRLVSTKQLKDGDIIAKDIISYQGGILLRHDTRFKEVFKSKLLERNISEVYIDDEISKGIEPKELLECSIKQTISQDIKSQFEKLQHSLELDVTALTQVTSFLIDELSQKEMILELEDLKANDNYTYEHCISVAILTNLVCNKLGMNPDLKEQIVMGALIHDIGKIIIPKDILNKPGALTDSEYEVVKGHPEMGYRMIKDNIEISAVTKLTVLCHHEREDGSGYPLGKGKDLHIGTKIVAACDLFHALISNRCYRQGLPINEVVAIAQKEPINAEIRSIIEQLFAYYPVGSMVKLNDGKIALVEKNFSADVRRPLVRIIENMHDFSGGHYKINLQEEREYSIVGRYFGTT